MHWGGRTRASFTHNTVSSLTRPKTRKPGPACFGGAHLAAGLGLRRASTQPTNGRHTAFCACLVSRPRLRLTFESITLTPLLFLNGVALEV